MIFFAFQVRRAGLTEKTLDELEVARDITVRKRITKMWVGGSRSLLLQYVAARV